MAKKNALLPIFLIVAVDVLGMTIILPLLPFYAERFGATPFVVGLILMSYSFCQLFAGPVLGRLSDRHGRRPLLIVSQLGTFVGFLMLGFARSLPWIFFSRILDGATAGNLSLAQAYISDVTEPAERAKSFGIIGIAFGIGFMIGPALSGFLAQYDYTYPAWAAASLSFTSILCTYFLLPQAKPHQGDEEGPAGRRLSILDWGAYAGYFRRPGLGALLAVFFIFAVMFGLFLSGFALFAERRFAIAGRPFGPKEVGYLYAYSGLLGAIIQGGLLGRLVQRFGERRLMLAGFVSAAGGFMGLAFARPLGVLVAVFSATAFGNSLLRPCITALVTHHSGRREQGVVLGLTQSLYSIAMIVSAPVAGALIGRGLLSWWALAGAALAAAGLLAGFETAETGGA